MDSGLWMPRIEVRGGPPNAMFRVWEPGDRMDARRLLHHP
jgi:hypothetical protein